MSMLAVASMSEPPHPRDVSAAIAVALVGALAERGAIERVSFKRYQAVGRSRHLVAAREGE